MSLFTYNFLTNIAGLTPQVIPTGSGAAAPRLIEDVPVPFERNERTIEPLIHMLGVIDIEGTVDVLSVARIETRYLRGNGRQTGYIAQHLDAAGKVLAADTVYGYSNEGAVEKKKSTNRGNDDCGCRDCDGDCSEPQPLLIKAMLRDTAPGTTLRIVKRGEVVWERRGAGKPPALSGVRATLNKNGELELSWKIGGELKAESKVKEKEEVDIWLCWTNDDGKTWHALTVGLHGSSAAIDPEQLPSGNIRFEVLANDGFYTVRASSNVIELPARPPAVAILYPGAGARVYGDRLIHLWGTVSSFAGANMASDSAEWFIDDKSVGRGLDLWVENPGAGRHRVRLQVTEAGLTGMAASDIEVKSTTDSDYSAG
jgi:hypothetical protein